MTGADALGVAAGAGSGASARAGTEGRPRAPTRLRVQNGSGDLLGPRVHELVALLDDGYQTLDRAFIDARLDDFAAAPGLDAGRAAIGRELDVVTAQRKLKDAGRFIFIDRVKTSPWSLPHFEPSLER